MVNTHARWGGHVTSGSLALLSCPLSRRADVVVLRCASSNAIHVLPKRSHSATSGISSPRAEECRPSCSLGGQSGPPSSSSGVMTRANMKALQALEGMKLCHDFNSTPQSSFSGYVLIPHFLIFCYLFVTTYDRFCRDGEHEFDARLSKGRRRTSDATTSTPVAAPALTQPDAAPSPPKVLHLANGRRLKSLVGTNPAAKASKSRVALGKKPAAPVEETPTPRVRPKSVKELLSARLGEDGRDYHVIWQDGEALIKYVREMQSEVLMDQATKTMVLREGGEYEGEAKLQPINHESLLLFIESHQEP
ncbi:hypothetical protein BHE74_00045124 [Ensete ventricosum]|nr:hypothetical protein BHE74_00045124 [Ensete ventricosum]